MMYSQICVLGYMNKTMNLWCVDIQVVDSLEGWYGSPGVLDLPRPTAATRLCATLPTIPMTASDERRLPCANGQMGFRGYPWTHMYFNEELIRVDILELQLKEICITMQVYAIDRLGTSCHVWESMLHVYLHIPKIWANYSDQTPVSGLSPKWWVFGGNFPKVAEHFRLWELWYPPWKQQFASENW